MTRILVAGARGLLGSSLVPHLRQLGHEVLCASRNNDTEVRADLTDYGQVLAAFNEAAPDIILNLAALTDVDQCELNPQAAYLANVRTVENLARWIEHGGNRCHIVHISTDQIYDGLGPHREDDVTLTNYYGFSKYAGELAALTVSGTVLRTNFFGASKSSTKRSFSDWLVNSLSQGESITVFDDVQFSPLNLQHLIELMGLVISKRYQGIFNLGSKDRMSKSDFAFTLAAELNLPTQNMRVGSSSDANLAAYRPKDMSMDSTLFESTFRVKMPTIIDGIKLLQRSI